MVSDSSDLEVQANRLEASDRYRVLRRLEQWVPQAAAPGEVVRRGLFVDVETTGLDPTRHEIIELAMVPFAYTVSGWVLSVGAPFEGLREPGEPIPPEITALTGIDDAMVRGKTIDPAEMAAFAEPAHLVVAHNAAFDRRFLERLKARGYR